MISVYLLKPKSLTLIKLYAIMKKDKNGLDNVLSSQRYVNDKNGLRYSKFEDSSQIKKTLCQN